MVKVPSGDGADRVVASDEVGDALASADAQPAARVLPEAVVAQWMPWVDNGVAVAAGIVVLLLVAAGVLLALRREITDPPV